MASSPRNPNPDLHLPNNNNNDNNYITPSTSRSLKDREEGELTSSSSSSDDDNDHNQEIPAYSATPSTSVSAPPSISGPNASMETEEQAVISGKSASSSLMARSQDTRSSKPNSGKGSEKNQVLPKVINPGWHAPCGNPNLVISFSDDDDSDSDSERKSRATNEHPHVVQRIQKPPTLPYSKLEAGGRKIAPKKVALSRSFIKTVTQIQGSSLQSKPSTKQRSWSKKSTMSGKSLSNLDHGGKNEVLSQSKLQDLRQQIAMRENELKLKIAQKNKENVSDSFRCANAMDQSKVSGKKGRAVSLDVQGEPMEPAVKRLKITHSANGQRTLKTNREIDFEKPMPVLKDLRSGSSASQAENMADVTCHVSTIKQKEVVQRPSRTPVKDAAGVTVSCSLSEWIAGPKEKLVVQNKSESITNAISAVSRDKSMSKHPSVLPSMLPSMVDMNQPSSSAPNQEMHLNSMSRVADYPPTRSVREKLNHLSNGSLQDSSLQASDNKFGSPDASPDNCSFLHSLGRPTVSGRDVDSLFDLEKLHDKELEEAQEYRRSCEIEERKALEAYRKAQRALAEANARCSYLYRRRELYSAQLRSLLMEDSSLLWSSNHIRQTEETLNISNNVAEANLGPASKYLLQPDLEVGNQSVYHSNVQSAEGDQHNERLLNGDGHFLGSEACSEPDVSTSELLGQGDFFGANSFHSPSDELRLSPNGDDGAFPLDHRSGPDRMSCQREEENSGEVEKDMELDPTELVLPDGSQESLHHEAYLRSKLISRLGVTDSSKSSDGVVVEDNTSVKTKIVSHSPSDHKVLDDSEGLQRDITETPRNLQIAEPDDGHFLKNSCIPTSVSEESFDVVDITSTATVLSASIMRSAMKVACPASSVCKQYPCDHSGSPGRCDDDDDDADLARCSEDRWSFERQDTDEELVKCATFGKLDSYSMKSTVDPYWPLCMYELRGKCNNDECPWQHLRDYSLNNADQHMDSDDLDCQSKSSYHAGKEKGSAVPSNVLIPPRYLVCLDSLKAAHSCNSLQAHHLGVPGRVIFSNTLAISSTFPKQIPSSEPFLHGNEGRMESYGSNKYALSLRNRTGPGNPLNGSATNDQLLEMALLLLSQEVNKVDDMKKALSLLTRALKADPASLHLWIIYLLLYYSIKNSVGEVGEKGSAGEDDVFARAVKHNESSYEIWLLYVNSRRSLIDRLAAYDRALSSMGPCASTTGDLNSSACILDLSLQMLNFLCMSGHTAKAIQRVQRLILADGDLDESHTLLLSDILPFLTISDKCTFWVCCVYLVMYRKLPDALVQQFEFAKDISVIEWPAVDLTCEERQMVCNLMEKATESVGPHIGVETCESTTLKPAHLIAVNHVKLIAAIDGEESRKMLLEKYTNSYPLCLQLVILSARAHKYDDDDDDDKIKSLEGFEGALSNWPKEVPGIHCIWNQYAEHALENGRPDRAREVMERWYNSAGKPTFGDGLDGDHEKNLSVDLLLRSKLKDLLSCSSNMDVTFGLLNLALYRILHNDGRDAHMAIDKALKITDSDALRHCVREHAVFLFNNRSQLGMDASVRGLLDILRGYLIHVQAPVPLTRNFIQGIQKTRLRQLVSNTLSPISPDTVLVNSVLEIWFGSSLLPQNSDDLKDIVDLVEGIFQLSPANCGVAISVCKLLSRDLQGLDAKSTSVLFWASSLLVNTICSAVPVPPEFVWVEAAILLPKLTNLPEISESFHRRALSVYPFSIKLWKSFLNLSTVENKRSSIVEAAKEKGIHLE